MNERSMSYIDELGLWEQVVYFSKSMYIYDTVIELNANCIPVAA